METTVVDESGLDVAVAALKAGGLVAFPTETVYGLGADAGNGAAVRRIFEAKGRPTDHPVIVHLARRSEMDTYAASVPDAARRLADAFWPGPLTLIVERNGRIASEVVGDRATVGLRVPDHPIAFELLSRFGGSVAAPSANRYGGVSPTTAQHVLDDLDGLVDVVVDGGPCPVGVESTIIEFAEGQPTLLRPGGIASVEIEAAVGRPLSSDVGGLVRAPGMIVSHYAPRASVELVTETDLLALDPAGDERVGVIALTAFVKPTHLADSAVGWWTLPDDAVGYAAKLYATMREADNTGIERLLVMPPKHGRLLEAVLNRLKKAAA